MTRNKEVILYLENVQYVACSRNSASSYVKKRYLRKNCQICFYSCIDLPRACLQFVNKEIEFINLPCIFKDKSVISSIPTYFENKESPMICY